MDRKSEDKEGRCRFGFPHKESTETVVLPEEDIAKKNGKIVVLKRKKSEARINNYNPDILLLWGANMDIQPVGGMYGVSYYVAKYVSKEENVFLRPSLPKITRLAKYKKNHQSMMMTMIYSKTVF